MIQIALVLWISTATGLFFRSTATDITLTTPRQSGAESAFTFTLLSDYGYSVGDSTSITLEVKACQDAYIGLMEVNDKNIAIFNIAIGGWNNGKTVIYPRKIGGGILTFYNGALLSCMQHKKFEATWNNGKIQLWTFVSSTWTKVLSYTTSKTSKINFIGLSTCIYATGYWKILIPDTTTTSTTTTEEQTTTQTTDGPTTSTTEAKTTTQETTVDPTTSLMTTTTNSTDVTCTPITAGVNTTKWCMIVCPENITEEQLQQVIIRLKDELKIDKKTTSQQINSLISVDDRRPSAAYIGYSGVVLIGFVFGGILLIDLPNLKRMFKKMYRNIVS